MYKLLLFKVFKLFNISLNHIYFYNFIRYGVAAGVEHKYLFQIIGNVDTVIDIGANRGQFSLISRYYLPSANIIAFEPLDIPEKVCRKIFCSDLNFTLYKYAIGPKETIAKMHISAKDDSSSLFPINDIQHEIFPGTDEVGVTNVAVAPLSKFVSKNDIAKTALLKIDVQGFEFKVLQGCENMMGYFNWVYCECSFVELYSGQKFASDVIDWLSHKGFIFCGVFNTSYDHNGQAVQADFLFSKDGKAL